MKKLFSTTLAALSSITLLLSARSSGTETAASPQPSQAAKATEAAKPTEASKAAATANPKKDMKGEITVWAFTDKASNAAAFNKEYPNIKVNTVIMDLGAMHEKLKTTLAAGTGAPDVAEVEQGQFPRYMTGNVLEDPFLPP